jgi:hypothetical protein
MDHDAGGEHRAVGKPLWKKSHGLFGAGTVTVSIKSMWPSPAWVTLKPRGAPAGQKTRSESHREPSLKSRDSGSLLVDGDDHEHHDAFDELLVPC